MYLVSEDEEGIYLNRRLNTIRAAIEEVHHHPFTCLTNEFKGLDIVPQFFFGNSKILRILGWCRGPDSWICRLSRRIRLSIEVFYGRWYLPVPYRHPIRMVTGEVVPVTRKQNPSEEEVREVLGRVKAAVTRLYEECRPEWETRPLKIY